MAHTKAEIYFFSFIAVYELVTIAVLGPAMQIGEEPRKAANTVERPAVLMIVSMGGLNLSIIRIAEAWTVLIPMITTANGMEILSSACRVK